MQRIHRISREMLDRKLEQQRTDSECGEAKDFLSLLVHTSMRGQPGADTEAAMVDQVMTFLGAGHETVAGALSWVRGSQWLLA
jgi:cytochrome P450